MSKQWECKDCVKQGTDACYFKEVVDGYKYCHDIVVDVDYAYAQGRADVIEEFVEMLTNDWGLDIILAQSNKEKLKSFIVINGEQLKEQNGR